MVRPFQGLIPITPRFLWRKMGVGYREECFSLLRKNPGPPLPPGEGMVNPDLMPRSLISSQPGRGFDGTGSLPLTPWKRKNPGPPLLCLKYTAQGGVKPAPHLQGGEHQGWLVRKHKEKEGTMNLQSGNSGLRPGGLTFFPCKMGLMRAILLTSEL